MEFLKSRFLRKDDLALRKVAGETILVPVRNSVAGLESVFTMNEVGGAIWKLLDGRTGESIAGELCVQYETDPETAKADVERFLKTLDEAGLIDITAPEEGA